MNGQYSFYDLGRTFITRGLRVRGGRAATSADAGNVPQVRKIRGRKLIWIDLESPDRRYLEDLVREYGLNELNVEDCLTKFELPKLDSYDDHFFTILHFPPLEQKVGISKSSQLAMFVGRDFLITVHQGDLRPLTKLVRMLQQQEEEEKEGDLDKREDDSPLGGPTSILLHKIVDELVDDLMHISRKIIANLDELEDRVFDERTSAARKIAMLRREINRLRRMARPLKRFVQEIASNVQRLSDTQSDDIMLLYDDTIDHIEKIIETLEESRETMEIYKDTDYMLSTEKTNKVLSVLTIIFTLAIPATVVGTFYGMNVSLPGGIDDGGVVSTHIAFTPFVILILASAIPAALMFAYFKRRGWMTT